MSTPALRRRAPWQVLVVPWRAPASDGSPAGTRADGDLVVAVFLRSDMDAWQFIAGGGEEGETPVEAARREAFEEGGIPLSAPMRQLACVGSIPVHGFPDRAHWPPELTHIPEYAFAVDCAGIELTLSAEHRDVRWLSLAEALPLLTWDSNRVAVRAVRGMSGVPGTQAGPAT